MTRLCRHLRTTFHVPLALTALMSALLLLPSSSAGQDYDAFTPIGAGWQTYVNARYGVRFDYPADIFTALEPPINGDGRSFASADASLTIFAAHNTLNESPATLKRDMMGSPDYQDVTYSPSGKTWLVLSGYRGDKIYYEKYFFRHGTISAFGIEFPAHRKPFYAPMIERIEDSFRAGRPN